MVSHLLFTFAGRDCHAPDPLCLIAAGFQSCFDNAIPAACRQMIDCMIFQLYRARLPHTAGIRAAAGDLIHILPADRSDVL